MMKKIIASICALTMGLTMLASCGTTDTKDEAKTPELSDIKTAISEAYDEGQFLPTDEFPDEMFLGEFPVTEDLIEEKLVTAPLIGMHPDRLVLIKAKEGKGEELEKELIAIKDQKIQQFMGYPSSLAKTQAAEVVRNGDYVAYLLVGSINEDMDASEEDALKFAQDEVKKAVDAFNAQF